MCSVCRKFNKRMRVSVRGKAVGETDYNRQAGYAESATAMAWQKSELPEVFT
jgi:hypothetical protein